MLHISDFTAQLGNPAKAFIWDVEIPALPVVSGIRAQSAQWPGVGSTDIDLFHMGQTAKFPGSVEYEHTWTCVMVEDEGGTIFNALYEWRQLVFNQKNAVQANVADFKRDITIRALTSNNVAWATCILKNAYPKNIDPVEMDKSANTEAWKWSVMWNFDWWE